jgi:hypothetical protein
MSYKIGVHSQSANCAYYHYLTRFIQKDQKQVLRVPAAEHSEHHSGAYRSSLFSRLYPLSRRAKKAIMADGEAWE